MTAHHEGPQEAPIVPPPPGSIADLFQELLPDVEFVANQGAMDVSLTIAREDVPRVLRAAKEESRLDFKFLRCLSGVDHMEGGLEVVYQLYSYALKHSIAIKVRLPLDDPRLTSVTPIWKGADWLERETAEMFGIVFEGHPNPVPLLLPDDMTDHHPLRKDNPPAQVEAWQGLRLGLEAAQVGHFPAGYESIAGEGGSEASEG
ncbi:MAG: NADH-quinone oxidoreductase subunit C [Dehalococcoidia bacterium]|jgi:NADH-quinone oxidoreductase subunit C